MNIKPNKNLKPSLSIPKPIIIFSKSLQVVSTKLTVLFAKKLFSTPYKFPTPKREQQLYNSAKKEYLNVTTIGKKIEVLTYGYSKKKVLLVHGWAGRGTQFYLLADKLLEKGYMVVTFDGPAHGKSEGKTTVMPEFLETINEIVKKHGPFETAIGHSFGGMTLYNAVATDLKVDKLVTIGAADTISEVIKNFTQNLGLQPKIAKKIKDAYDNQLETDIDLHSSHAMAKQINIPTLVVHDTLDGDVCVSNAINIRQNLQKGTLYITNGLGHTKILRDTEVARTIVNFIINE